MRHKVAGKIKALKGYSRETGFTPLEILKEKFFMLNIAVKKKNYLAKKVGSRLPEGNLSQTGFTLVEVMVATVVLAFGVVIIFEVFLLSLDTANLFNNRLNAEWFLNEKIWQLQNRLDQPAEAFVPMHDEGSFVFNNKNFIWQVNLYLQDAKGELYLADAVLSWNQAGKKRSVNRQTLVKRYFNNSTP